MSIEEFKAFYEQREFRKKNKGKSNGTKFGVCPCCKTSKKLFLHHIDRGINRLNKDARTIWVCWGCHALIHQNKIKC